MAAESLRQTSDEASPETARETAPSGAPQGRQSAPFTRFEKVVLGLVFASMFAGVAASRIDLDWFLNVYVVEDGPIEWAGTLAFLAAAFVSANPAWRFLAMRKRLATATWVGLTLLFVFAAGEEISWGQRLFGIASPEFFQQHNLQDETNLHNLAVGGVKLNKLVFSQMVAVLIALYMVAVPFLYSRWASFRRFLDDAGVPVPAFRQIVAVASAFLVTELAVSGKRAELLEFAGAFLVLLIVRFPRNRDVARGLAPTRSPRLGEPGMPVGGALD